MAYKRWNSETLLNIFELLKCWNSMELPEIAFYRIRRSQISVLKNFAIFTRKHLCLSLLNKVAGLRPATLLKRDSNTRIFLQILQHFYEHLFVYNTFGGCFYFWICCRWLFLEIMGRLFWINNYFQNFKLWNSKTLLFIKKSIFKSSLPEGFC